MRLEAFREAIPKLFQTPETSEFQNTNLALIIIAVRVVVIAVPSVDILRVKTKGASLKAQIVALLKDEVSYVAAFIAVAIVAQGYHMADTIASLFVAFIIALGGIYLLKDNVHFLVGRAPSPQFFEKVESTAESVKGVLSVHDLKAQYVGPNIIQASLHVQVEKRTSVKDADRIAHEVEEKVSREVNCQYCVIHVDPTSD